MTICNSPRSIQSFVHSLHLRIPKRLCLALFRFNDTILHLPIPWWDQGSKTGSGGNILSIGCYRSWLITGQFANSDSNTNFNWQVPRQLKTVLSQLPPGTGNSNLKTYSNLNSTRNGWIYKSPFQLELSGTGKIWNPADKPLVFIWDHMLNECYAKGFIF